MDLGGHEVELRQLFAEEARERLESMTRLLVHAGAAVDDRELVTALFRDAHTVKGGAGTVGLPGVGRLAHAIEDLLSGVRAGSRPLTPTLADAILAGVDALGTIVPAAAAGEPHEAEVLTAEAALAAAVAAEPPAAPAGWTPPQMVVPQPAPPAPAAPEPTTNGRVAAAPPDAPAPAPARQAPAEPLSVPLERLDELVRLVGETVAGQLRLGELLRTALGRDAESYEEFRAFTQVLQELQDLAMRTRMVPVGRALPAVRRASREVARTYGKRVRLEVAGEDTELDRRVLDTLSEALLHLVRNAVAHGIETPEDRVRAGKDPEGLIRIEAEQRRAEVVVAVSDDGRGIDIVRIREVAPDAAELSDEEALQLIFRSGLSTASRVDEVAGRGVGLDVVRSRLDAIQGRVDVRSRPGLGTEFRIAVPVTLAVVPSLLLAAAGQRFAVPMHSVAGILAPDAEDRWAGGRQVIVTGGRPVPRSGLAETLGLAAEAAAGPTVLLIGRSEEHAFRVDRVVGQRQVVVKALSPVLPRLPAVAGVSVEPDGPILLVLDTTALVERAQRSGRTAAAATVPRPAEAPRSTRVLVVDDALIVREVERTILEQAGYEVVTAADGVEALAALASTVCDLVVTDVDMPRMDGIELTTRIRALPRLSQTPVILLTSHQDEQTRRRGLEAGADAYVVKSAFDRVAMLETIERALGRR